MSDFEPRDIGPRDTEFIGRAATYLERPGFMVRMSGVLGRPAELLLRALPAPAERLVTRSTERALRAAMKASLATLRRPPAPVADRDLLSLYGTTLSSGALHTGAGYFTGFTGGLLGIAALPVELPLTTAIMLRSIADIACRLGHDVREPAVQLECLAVLGLGHAQAPSDGLRADSKEPSGQVPFEPGYYAVRTSLISAVGNAARYVAGATPGELVKAMMRGRAPALSGLLASIANRFELIVAQKTVLQLLPVLGAATGTAVNLAFLDHFNEVARYHFGLRLLEQRHGEEAVRKAYTSALLPPGSAPAEGRVIDVEAVETTGEM
jgi:hypothetical protein